MKKTAWHLSIVQWGWKGVFLFLFLLSPHAASAQRVVWWNVENLFDTKCDSLKDDHEFLPDGARHWTPGRYWRKLDNISRTVAALAGDTPDWPMLIGLGEVENDSVLYDLTRRSPLRAAGYSYVVTEGSDRRGINVGLLYQPRLFRCLYSQGIRVPLAEQGLKPTRDILHVVGVQSSGDTLHVLAVHFPSQAGGIHLSAKNRSIAAQTLRSVVDSLTNKRVLVMGDFNAEIKDKIFRQFIPPLVSLTPRQKRELRKEPGTYFFQGRWSFLDHILVSPRLEKELEPRFHVANFDNLLDDNGVPKRTYRGPAYVGGYSDHLPIRVDWFGGTK